MEKNTELIVVGGSPLEEGNCLSCFFFALDVTKMCRNIFSFCSAACLANSNTKAMRLVIFPVSLSNCSVRSPRIFDWALVSFSSMRLSQRFSEAQDFQTFIQLFEI